MTDYSIYLPSYSIGRDACRRIGSICQPYGRRAVVIGGKRAMEAIGPEISRGAEGVIEIVEFRWYGGECSEEAIAALLESESVQSADMIFAAGGGKALDTGKLVGLRAGKPVFTFPTIASTCAACTAVSIVYHEDGSFAGPCFLPRPPVHAFLCTDVLAKAPPRYLWAGLGDTYAKYFEATVSSRGDEPTYYQALGIGMSRMCLDPLLRYGAAAMADHRRGIASEAFETVVQTIVVTTAIVSILVTSGGVADYNSGLAHAVFYALTTFPELPIESRHLHGEVVGFGTLVLLLVDGQTEMFRTLYDFNRAVGLPTSLADIEVPEEALERVIPQILRMSDIAHYPYRVTEEALRAAFTTLNHLAQSPN